MIIVELELCNNDDDWQLRQWRQMDSKLLYSNYDNLFDNYMYDIVG